VQDTTDPPTGHYVEIGATNAAQFGWYPFTDTPRPDEDHVRSVEREGDGFVVVWTFDQALADANAAAAEDDTERAAVRAMISSLQDLAQPGPLTSAEQTQAIPRLARVALRLVKDSI
jgi:hypothetical protein